jgi:hypothetical protein
LLESTTLSIDPGRISVLVRKQEQAEVLSKKGVKPILFGGLDDTTALKDAASQHDIVINAASAFKPQAAEALILGLAERKRQVGNDAHLIHVRSAFLRR